ncbi:MAG: class I SAM-dependent methyltransferase [Myxococcota bacterium]|jgi:SAM-dependent methyltransferase|nr:class I SAM-dependent methyltransferase [Myxococcota bacterium]
MPSKATLQAYELMPYPSYAHPHCHPDRLAVIAALHGLVTAPVEGCRLLELGCATGANLLPLAASFPGSSFVGVDLSPRMVREGQAQAAGLGLTNLTLLQADIRELDLEPGQFDYLICHGVFSWVDAEVQRRIFELCRRCLTPRGIAYISYNAHPGWRLASIVRDFLYFPGAHSPVGLPPAAQVAAGRHLIDRLSNLTAERTGPLDRFLAGEALRWARHDSGYLAHEYFEPHNQAFYLTDFLAGAEGLQYLGDADPGLLLLAERPGPVRDFLAACPGRVEQQQYLDFLETRQFRRTLLCAAGHTLLATPRPETLLELRVSTPSPVQAPPRGQEGPLFLGNGEESEAIADPLLQQALRLLGEVAPASWAVTELFAAACTGLGDPAAEGPPDACRPLEFAGELLRLFGRGLLELHRWSRPVTGRLSESPEASAFARAEARLGWQATSAQHFRIDLDGLERRVLPLLDGRLSRAELLDLLRQTSIPAGPDEDEGAWDGLPEEVLAANLAEALDRFRRQGLLVA